MNKTLTCSHCGHIDEDVIVRTVYVDGKGLVSSIECQDRVACWARWNKQHPTIRKEIVTGWLAKRGDPVIKKEVADGHKD